jgi:DNA invertase Pin-like site-specific DNA recombinase
MGRSAHVAKRSSLLSRFHPSHSSIPFAPQKREVVLNYGYARVSTEEQETNLQLDALELAGCKEIFSEKTSSVGKRPQLQLLLAKLRRGDILVVYKLDRLARSLTDLLRIIERLQTLEVGLKSLTEPIDTTSAIGRLMLQIVGAFSEFERNLIRERSIAGQRAAVARGAVVGRPSKLTAEKRKLVAQRYATGFYTMAALAAIEGVDVNVIKRAIYGARPLENARI